MSSTFESSIKQIPHSQESVYATLSDLNNLERIKDRIPADKVKDFSFDADSISIEAPMVGSIKMRIIDREPYKTIKFETMKLQSTEPYQQFEKKHTLSKHELE